LAVLDRGAIRSRDRCADPGSRPRSLTETETGEIEARVDAVPDPAAEAWADDRADGRGAVGDHRDVACRKSGRESLRGVVSCLPAQRTQASNRGHRRVRKPGCRYVSAEHLHEERAWVREGNLGRPPSDPGVRARIAQGALEVSDEDRLYIDSEWGQLVSHLVRNGEPTLIARLHGERNRDSRKVLARPGHRDNGRPTAPDAWWQE